MILPRVGTGLEEGRKPRASGDDPQATGVKVWSAA